MKKGFTLIELLAVIIILAIVALIATPIVLDVVDDAKKSAAKSEASMIVSGVNNYCAAAAMKEQLTGTPNICKDGVTKEEVETMVDLGNAKVNSITFDKKVTALEVVSNGKTVIYNGKEYIIDGKIKYMDSVLNGAYPELDYGMIPVIISSTGEVTKADIYTEWYNYSEKEWANAVLVKDSVREEYINAEANTVVELTDIQAYYVWVPRYRYEIFTDVDNILTNQDYETNTAQQINIVFESKETSKSTGSEEGEYLTHPAFTFGDAELNGIWVGKFETTGTSTNPTILPYTSSTPVTSLRSQNVSSQFATSQLLAYYGANNMDAHMMKNMEWGAVAYLTNSQYGRCEDGVCEEVRINNSSSYYTGCAATTAATTKQYAEYTSQTDGSEGYYSGCENAYNTEIGVLASTTGNITGIYDMSGGTWEYVMAVMEDSLNSGVALSGRNNSYNSGFTGNLGCPSCDSNDSSITSVTGVTFPESKYYDLYTYGTSYNDKDAYLRGQLGDATVELGSFTSSKSTGDNNTRYYSNWNKDYASFVFYGTPWLLRGGYWYYGSGSGVFAFYRYYGSANGSSSFRSVLS